jgi:hypothetical protein
VGGSGWVAELERHDEKVVADELVVALELWDERQGRDL